MCSENGTTLGQACRPSSTGVYLRAFVEVPTYPSCKTSESETRCFLLPRREEIDHGQNTLAQTRTGMAHESRSLGISEVYRWSSTLGGPCQYWHPAHISCRTWHRIEHILGAHGRDGDVVDVWGHQMV